MIGRGVVRRGSVMDESIFLFGLAPGASARFRSISDRQALQTRHFCSKAPYLLHFVRSSHANMECPQSINSH
jgi:hypothetical protein